MLKRIFAALLAAAVVGAGTGTVALAAEAGVPTAVSEETKQAETREEAPAQEGDFQWEENEDGTAAITGYTGEGGAVEIPAVIGGKTVTVIGKSAFENCTGLTAITIPNSVTTIGDWALYGCTGVTAYMVQEGNDNYISQDGVLFDKEKTTLIQYPVGKTGSYEVPEGVTVIGKGAFGESAGLTGITLPDSVTAIEAEAFYGCTGLTTITIPKSVTAIEDLVFEGCISLTAIMLPESVTAIGEGAFYGCTGLISVNLGSVETIGEGAFYGCTGLTAITIPNSVTTIEDWAFENCTGLTAITIPNSVTAIEDWVFEDCTGLTAITIPNSVTAIWEGAFYGCTGLTAITIPNSVTAIGEGAFYGCTGVTAYMVQEGNDNYISQDGVLFNKEKTTLVQYPAKKTGSYEVPEGVTVIGKGAFAKNAGLTAITIPESVTAIGEGAFYGCTGLTAITLPESVTAIGEGAFYGCTGLTAITIPNSVTTIEDWAFENCTGLTAITIPKSVTAIGDWAFYGCTGVTAYTVQEGNDNYISQDGVLFNKEKTTLVQYPAGKTGSCEVPEGVTVIGEGAFAKNAGLTAITIPESITAIEDEAFYGCTGLTSVTLSNAPALGEDVFENCAEGLTFHVPWNAAGYDAAPWSGYEVLYDVLAAPEIRSVSNTANGVQITWDAVPGAVQYRVFYETDNGGWSKIADTADTSYTWENAQDGMTYTFTVRCLSADGESYTSDYAIGKTITYKEESDSGSASDQPSGKDPEDQNAGSENPDNGNQSEAVAGSGSPETGDSMSLLLWTALLLIGAGAGSLALVLRRRIQS